MKNNWFENNPWKAKMIIVLVVILALEISVRLLVFLNLAPYQRYPTAVGGPVFWDDIDPAVGVWRYPKKTFRHKSSCFDVTYHTNSYGARDPERFVKSGAPKRVIVLGDSYVEGYGVERGKRFTDILENETGVEYLNFGVSGSFGTIQEWQIYENLASKFDHTDVMIFILPANDFSDNNPADFPQKRYRPYLRKSENGFELYYTVKFENRQKEFRDWGLTIKNTIDNTSYLANFLRFANREVKNKLQVEGRIPAETTQAHYNNFSSTELQIMLHCLEKVGEIATNKKINIYTIPSQEDYNWAFTEGYDFKIVAALQTFADKFDNVTYKDLLPHFLQFASQHNLTYNDFTHKCDGHWNELGHRVATQVILMSDSTR